MVKMTCPGSPWEQPFPPYHSATGHSKSTSEINFRRESKVFLYLNMIKYSSGKLLKYLEKEECLLQHSSITIHPFGGIPAY